MNPNYIYQTIHTLSHHPLYVAEHCRLLERAFLDIYFRPLLLDEDDIYKKIVELLRHERVTQTLSVFVELRIDIQQNEEIVISGRSLYDGYAIRSISPFAVAVTFDSPFGLHSSSARRAALSFAGDIARNLGGEIALECSRDGALLSLDGAAIFALIRNRLIASTTIDSVEREFVIAAAADLSIEVERREIMRNELYLFDEVFGCDHNGIIAISGYGEQRYMSLIAEKIAKYLSQPW
ncbi:MAG: aminotransferase class IV [Rikenellaceae bacterium]